MLEVKIDALTAAVQQLTAVLQATGTSVAQAAPVQPATQFSPPPQAAPPQPTGMPGAPFPGVPVTPPPQAAPSLPFSDAQGLLAWAQGKYQANPNIGPALEQILTAHGLKDITSAQPAQFVSLFNAINAL